MRFFSTLVTILILAGFCSAVHAAIAVSPSALPSATFNQSSYTQTVTASGGTGAVTLSLTSGAVPTGMTFTPGTGVLNGKPTALGTFTFTITATDATLATGSTTYVVPVIQFVSGSFIAVPSLAAGRVGHTATLLPSGKVLVVGGANSTFLAATELYDPGTNTWSAAASLATGRQYHTATLLPSGKVLVAGGYVGNGICLDSSEVYDPATNTWSAAGSLATVRGYHTATLLPNGKVLVAGGYFFNGEYLNTAEMYDPASNSWSAAGSFSIPRRYHTATLLPSGKVLIAGGTNPASTSAQLYDPASNTWSAAASLGTARELYTATLLPSGKVLVAGGINLTSNPNGLISAEVYDPASDTWSAAGNLNTARYAHTATLLPSGKVFVSGGFGGSVNPAPLSSSAMYDPASNTWSGAATLLHQREAHTATLLPSGKVLVAGGFDSSFLSSAEISNFAAGTATPAGNLATARSSHTATLLPSGKVLVAGGNDGASNLISVEVYNPASNAWSAAGSLSAARQQHTATLLSSGKVLVAGGVNGSSYLSSAEVYDPASNTWSAAGDLSTARYAHTATLLPSGKVLVAAGYGNSGRLSSAEVYDPASNTWVAAGNLGTARQNPTATLLPSGKVLVAGGYNSGYLSSVEMYDSVSNTWGAAGSLITARQYHTATLLPSGKVLAAGGINASGYLSSAEVYDPASNTWSATGSLITARDTHSATLLPSGKVLVAGGVNGSANLSSAETYDPVSINIWRAAGSLSTARYGHTATLLASGKVLIAGGSNGPALSSAELLDDGLQYQDAWRPTIATATSPLQVQTVMTLTGTLFTGISEGFGGAITSSSSNFPFVVLQSLANEEVRYLQPDSATLWTATSYKALTVAPLNPGYALLTVIVNGIPSPSKIITISNAVITISPGTLPNGQVGAAYSQTLSASGGTAPYSFAVTVGALPAGLTLSASGTLSGTPTVTGTTNFTVTATDSINNIGSTAYALTVTAPTIAFAPATLANAQVGAAYTQAITASSGTAPYTYAVTSGALAAGLSLTSGGLISGTPTAGGTFSVTVTATDSSIGSGPFAGSKAYTLTVTAPTIAVAPATLPNAQVGAFYVQSITASGGTASYSYAITSGALPAGLSLLPTGQIFGAPTAGGIFNLSVTATDSTTGTGPFTASAAYTLTVAAPAITLAPLALPSPQVGVPYGQTIAASGGTAPYTYAVTSGALPAGLTLTSAGLISGTPTAGGSFNLTITATDSSTGSGPFAASAVYAFTVAAPTILLTPATLLDATVDVPYSQAITASGGTAPYTYALTSGTLPSGLNLTTAGLLSGTPLAGGTFNIEVSATDSSTGTGPYIASKPYTLTVALTFAPATLPNGLVGVPYSQAITAGGSGVTYSYTVSFGALPPGLTLSSTGLISGTPTAGGSFTFAFIASDATGTYTGAHTYTFFVSRFSSTIAATDASAPFSSSDQNVTLTAAVSSAGGVVNEGDMDFQVRSGATIIGKSTNTGTVSNGTASVIFLLPAGTPRGLYTIQASYSGTAVFASSSDNTHTLTVHAPTLSSAPTAAPGTAGVGQIVTFSAAAADAFGDTVSYAWDFGDNLSGTGDSVTHAYAAPGTYLATVTVSDGRGGAVSGSVSVLVKAAIYGFGFDSDGDGYSDSFETGAGSEFMNAASTPLGIGAPPSATALTVKAVSIKLNFVKPNDSISLTGFVPVPIAFSFAAKGAVVQVSGYVKGFTLDAKGHSTPKGSASLALAKPKKGLSAFTLKVAKANISALFKDAGLTAIASPNTPVQIVLTVLFNNAAYQSTETLLFTQRKGMSGSTKKAR